MPKTDGGPAFPRPGSSEVTREQAGMKLRDWFAGLAMSGMLAEDADAYTWEHLAVASYKAADAMLAERAKGSK